MGLQRDRSSPAVVTPMCPALRRSFSGEAGRNVACPPAAQFRKSPCFQPGRAVSAAMIKANVAIVLARPAPVGDGRHVLAVAADIFAMLDQLIREKLFDMGHR